MHKKVSHSLWGHFRSLSNTTGLAWVDTSHAQVPNLPDLLVRCARNKSIREGKIHHAIVIVEGLQADTLLSNILINFYSKCGLVHTARQVFDAMTHRSIVSWNTIIGALIEHGQEPKKALNLFMEMLREGTPPSGFTLSSILCACAAKSDVEVSKQLHALACKTALCANVFVETALLDVYAKSCLIGDALQVFSNMEERTDVTWSSMVAGFVQNELYEEALTIVHKAQKMGLKYNQFTLSAALSACASLAAPIEGCQVHSVLLRTGFHSNFHVTASLIHMYAKCGSIEEAYSVFSCTEEKNIVFWNAIISGFSKHARCTEAMILFEKMQQVGLCPNEVTYIAVISACSHMGWVEEGKNYFDLMQEYNVEPNVHHYACMVDVLVRAGLIREARDLMENMPFKPTVSMWGSLLSSSRVYGDLESAEVAIGHLCEMEPDNAGNLVLLSNIYAVSKRWDDVARVRKILKESGAKKEKGKSWIEVRDRVHTFLAGDGSHPLIDEISAKLEDLEKAMRKLAYKAETDFDTHDVDDSQKEELLRYHSEKLALAFGLISLPSAAPVRIKKNLRICGDCHSTMKFASKITGRVIIVRDTNRFHHFRDGQCSCCEFW
ncbi:pentatricopeptide repeat-containing protein At5g04780, mitochondrial-like [Aristolochia californica]|uniref:pentatricopeptide repeat-containing protein At5g04780, mitochondrial-like n=1 Tax=Aristolochia californica TaxID=171875 RepID=UPI0035D5EB32